MPNPPLLQAEDGYYHPASEADVIALIQFAAANRRQVRVRGATHSVAWSIYTDPVNCVPANQTLVGMPPASDDLNLALDQMIAVDWLDEENGVVEVEAGCHLGRNPFDQFGSSTLENSFLFQAFQKGWAVSIVGGITHQTVSGFTGTGSAGGSVMYGYDNIVAFRVVDGTGAADWIEDSDPAFGAMLTSLGLLGIITKIRFQLIPMYNIQGTEVTTPPIPDACPIDLFGPGIGKKPSLQQFLTEQPYSRITWWPQEGCERVQIWQAERVPASDQDLVRYEEFTQDFDGQTKAFLASLIFVLAGNTDPARIAAIMRRNAVRYESNVIALSEKGAAPSRKNIADAAAIGGAATMVAAFISQVPGAIHQLYPLLLPLFAPLTEGEGKSFHDWYWRSLCMDNTADDELLGTEFCEIWAPIQFAEQAMDLMATMFVTRGADATGWYAQEIYAAAPSVGWLNPSYSDGSDIYQDGVVRFDVYWYRDNPGMPNGADGFFRQYWDLLRDNGIPFRFHWGKYIPAYDLADWAAYYRANLPKYDDFMALRQQRDPHNLFFTSYWRSRLLGLGGD
jgi:hypothetical protein